MSLKIVGCYQEKRLTLYQETKGLSKRLMNIQVTLKI